MIAGVLLLCLFSGRVATAEDVVNGQDESGFPAAVSLGAEFGEYTFSACTGSLITPRVVLTAAHCSADLPIDLVVQVGRAFFGASTASADQSVGFVDAVIHPEYVELSGGGGFGPDGQDWGDLGENDVALLELAEPVDVEPVWFRIEPLDDSVEDEPVTSVGFGVTNASADDSGTKRSAELVVNELTGMFLISLSVYNDNGANVCSGDSGGPQYHQEGDRWIQWAVHSWADSACSSMSGSTRTDVVAEWILDELEDIHGTRDRCEMWDVYDDGVCDEDCAEPDPDCEEEAAEEDGGDDSLDAPESSVSDDDDKGAGCSCGTAGSRGLGWILLPMVGLAARRRSTMLPGR